MDFRTLWYRVISTLQVHHTALRVELKSSNLGSVLVRSRVHSRAYSVIITIGRNHENAEIRMFESNVASHGGDSDSQIYRFTPGNENEAPMAIPDPKQTGYRHRHIAVLAADSPARIHEGIARWIEDIIRAEASRSAELGPDEFTEQNRRERIESLLKDATAGDEAAFHELVKELAGDGLYRDRCESHRAVLTLMSERGDARAQLTLGRQLCDPQIFVGDEMQPGLDWLKKAAAQGCPEAAYELCSQH